jgi:DNA (cytosine-5)-methyltransferase 1
LTAPGDPRMDLPPQRRPARPIAIDLFAGAGGLALGFEQAGYDVVAAVEYDPVHAATHLYNFSDCEIVCRDAPRLTPDVLLAAAKRGFQRLYPELPWPGRVDAVIGGPPCQGFSAGGTRQQEDDRNHLLITYVKFVVLLKPRTFCLENVAGILEARFDTLRETAFKQLRQAGYSISGIGESINSLHFGVPQIRHRVIVLGALDGPPPDRPVGTGSVVSVADALDGLPLLCEYEDLFTADTAKLSHKDAMRRVATKSKYARQLAGLEPMQGDRARHRLWNPQLLTNSRRTVHQAATIGRFKQTEPGSVEPKSRLYRLPLDGPSRTLRAGTGAERGAHTSPRPIHPTEDRVITVREAARLHGYPDWFRFHTTNWHGHRQIGNSVPPPLARAAAEALLESLELSPPAPQVALAPGDESLLHLSRKEAQPVVNGRDEELPPARSRAAGQRSH